MIQSRNYRWKFYPAYVHFILSQVKTSTYAKLSCYDLMQCFWGNLKFKKGN